MAVTGLGVAVLGRLPEHRFGDQPGVCTDSHLDLGRNIRVFPKKSLGVLPPLADPLVLV